MLFRSAKLAFAPSNAQTPEALRVGTAVSFKLSDGSLHCGVVEKVHGEGEAYSLVEDGTGIRWQNHPARSLKARKSAAKPVATDADAVLSFLTPAQRQKFVENEALDCLALLDDEDLDDLLAGDAAAKASFRFRYPDPSQAADAAGTTTNNPEPATTRAPVRFEVADEIAPPEPPPTPEPLPYGLSPVSAVEGAPSFHEMLSHVAVMSDRYAVAQIAPAPDSHASPQRSRHQPSPS